MILLTIGSIVLLVLMQKYYDNRHDPQPINTYDVFCNINKQNPQKHRKKKTTSKTSRKRNFKNKKRKLHIPKKNSSSSVDYDADESPPVSPSTDTEVNHTEVNPESPHMVIPIVNEEDNAQNSIEKKPKTNTTFVTSPSRDTDRFEEYIYHQALAQDDSPGKSQTTSTDVAKDTDLSLLGMMTHEINQLQSLYQDIDSVIGVMDQKQTIETDEANDGQNLEDIRNFSHDVKSKIDKFFSGTMSSPIREIDELLQELHGTSMPNSNWPPSFSPPDLHTQNTQEQSSSIEAWKKKLGLD